MARTPDKINSGEENSPAAPAGIRTRNLSTTSPVLLTNKLSRLPQGHRFTQFAHFDPKRKVTVPTVSHGVVVLKIAMGRAEERKSDACWHNSVLLDESSALFLETLPRLHPSRNISPAPHHHGDKIKAHQRCTDLFFMKIAVSFVQTETLQRALCRDQNVALGLGNRELEI